MNCDEERPINKRIRPSLYNFHQIKKVESGINGVIRMLFSEDWNRIFCVCIR